MYVNNNHNRVFLEYNNVRPSGSQHSTHNTYNTGSCSDSIVQQSVVQISRKS